jgi:hypothetical protein
MEARSQSAAHPNEINFIFNLNAFSWKAMKPLAVRRTASLSMINTHSFQAALGSRQRCLILFSLDV